MKKHPEAAPRQLSLNVQLNDQATFDNFFCNNNQPEKETQNLSSLVTWLQNWCSTQQATQQEPFALIWGSKGSGRSHLLQACCQQASANNLNTQYLPLAELLDFPPAAIFEGLANTQLLCIDDVDLIEGKPDWEQALFNLYNQMRESGHQLLISANCPPHALSAMLPDLVSRLSWGPVFHLATAEDDLKKQILIFRANKRGIIISEEVANYLLRRVSRDMPALIALVDQLDRLSLEHKRALTIPFVKGLLEEE